MWDEYPGRLAEYSIPTSRIRSQSVLGITPAQSGAQESLHVAPTNIFADSWHYRESQHLAQGSLGFSAPKKCL
jgi:hypothetical protein